MIEKTITLPVQLNLSRALDLSTPRWFYNGFPISTSKYNATYTIHGDTIYIHISLQTNNSTAEDAGLYIFALNMDIVSLLNGGFLQNCSDNQYHYVDYLRSYLWMNSVTLLKAVFRIEEYRKFSRLHAVLPACVHVLKHEF